MSSPPPAKLLAFYLRHHISCDHLHRLRGSLEFGAGPLGAALVRPEGNRLDLQGWRGQNLDLQGRWGLLEVEAHLLLQGRLLHGLEGRWLLQNSDWLGRWLLRHLLKRWRLEPWQVHGRSSGSSSRQD